MLQAFFLDKFEFDYQVNRTWCAHLQANEDQISDFIRKQMSHCINMHHIWLSRLKGSSPESEEWDLLPLHFLERLAEENFRQTSNYLEQFDQDEKIHFHSSEGVAMEKQAIDVLYHILQHSQYHRAQIAREMRVLELDVPSMQFIQYH